MDDQTFKSVKMGELLGRGGLGGVTEHVGETGVLLHFSRVTKRDGTLS